MNKKTNEDLQIKQIYQKILCELDGYVNFREQAMNFDCHHYRNISLKMANNNFNRCKDMIKEYPEVKDLLAKNCKYKKIITTLLKRA